MDVETIWKNILKNEGEKFHTKTGIEFVYSVSSTCNTIHPRNVKKSTLRSITKNKIEEILTNHKTLTSTAQINGQCSAPSYMFAILKDTRIVGE